MPTTVWASLILAIIAAGVAVAALVVSLRTHRRVDRITPDLRGLARRIEGKRGEEALAAIFAQLEGILRQIGEAQSQIAELDRVLSRAVRRVGLVRFDAHEDISGELSFALCMLDSRNNGIIMSSVYTLDACRVFVRGVLGGKTRHELMPEEAEALKQAMDEP